MKSSIFPLIILLVVCFMLPLFFKISEGMKSKNTVDISRNAYLNDISKNEYLDYYDYLNNKTNSSYDYYVDKQILKNGESVSAYMRNHRPTSNNEIDREIENNTNLANFFIHLFKTYSEPFTSSRTVKDLSTNEVFDISANYELYNTEGNLNTAKHDETDYKGLLALMNRKYNDLKSRTDQDSGKCNEGIKCIADFGTNVGEELCCGQTGVLQDTKYVCPSNKPTCSSFKCGSQFGQCT
jgi:hypothetical protein